MTWRILTMPTPHTTSNKRETLNLRIKSAERSLIDRAAKAQGKNRTDFVLEAARAAAEEALLDQALIKVSAKAYAEFLQRLNAKPQRNDALRKTMHAPTPWDKT
jgi:uncharacterized protein (DUF1778 family)